MFKFSRIWNVTTVYICGKQILNIVAQNNAGMLRVRDWNVKQNYIRLAELWHKRTVTHFNILKIPFTEILCPSRLLRGYECSYQRPSMCARLWSTESGCSPCDLALVDIQSSLGHITHTSLWLLGGERVEIMNVGGLICDLKVADAAVTLGNKRKRASLRLWSNGHGLPFISGILFNYFNGLTSTVDLSNYFYKHFLVFRLGMSNIKVNYLISNRHYHQCTSFSN